MYERLEAILLLGPTGSGKTPLGQLLHDRGLVGRRCVHFDFGENLRRIVADGQPDDVVSRGDVDFLRRVLRTGALLEDKDFPIAERVLRRFLSRQGVVDTGTLARVSHVGQNKVADVFAGTAQLGEGVRIPCRQTNGDPATEAPAAVPVARSGLPATDAGMLVVLNGLPRHIGQANSMAAILHVGTVVYLQCSAETVLARIVENTGGDRTGRVDDQSADVRRKLDIFAERTAPLVDFYGSNGARIIQLAVAADMTSEQIWLELDRRLRD